MAEVGAAITPPATGLGMGGAAIQMAVALLLILGVDTFLDMGRSATNAVGISLASAVVAKWEGELLSEADAEANAKRLDEEAALGLHSAPQKA